MNFALLIAIRLWKQLLRDRRTLALVLFAPIFYVVIFGMVFGGEIEGLPIIVINKDSDAETDQDTSQPPVESVLVLSPQASESWGEGLPQGADHNRTRRDAVREKRVYTQRFSPNESVYEEPRYILIQRRGVTASADRKSKAQEGSGRL